MWVATKENKLLCINSSDLCEDSKMDMGNGAINALQVTCFYWLLTIMKCEISKKKL